MLKKLWSYPRTKAIVFIMLAILFGLALGSYSPTDSAWNTASGNPYHNWLGPVGAWCADILLQLMGRIAFLVPLAFFIFAILLWRHSNWIKTRAFVLILSLLMAMWLTTDVPVDSEYAPWFKATSGSYIGYFLRMWVPLPTSLWIVLLWCLCGLLFIFALKSQPLK